LAARCPVRVHAGGDHPERTNFAGQQPPQLRDQSIEFYRFGIEFVARSECLLALASEGVRR
jgi:hypothetical protein